MPLQDLTPQLRTRLNRMERAVGWFITIATLILVGGFAYYLYNTAEQRGWFKIKAHYFVYLDKGDGVKVGDEVLLMGFHAGNITSVKPMPPKWGVTNHENVYVEFEVLEEDFGYIWTDDSKVEVKNAGFLSQRELDITKGTHGHATYITKDFRDDLTLDAAKALPNLDHWRLGEDILDGTNMIAGAWTPLGKDLEKITGHLGSNNLIRAIDSSVEKHALTAKWNDQNHAYDRYTKTTSPYELPLEEDPPVMDRLQAMVAQIQGALPGVLQLTNQISAVLSNATQATSNLNQVAMDVRPVIAKAGVITGNLTNPVGSLGEWFIPTNINQKLDTMLETANGTLINLNTNLVTLNRTLDNLANITSNLNTQVQANPNILSNVSSIVVHSDEFIQGLKKFWLFRHLFAAHPASKTPEKSAREKAQSPKQQSE